MRTPIRALLLLCCLVVIGCGCDDGTSPPPADPPLATATIGAAGGDISSDGFSLAVPAGAFDGDVSLALYRDADSNPYGADAVSDIYRLEGLPAQFTTPLTCRVQTATSKDVAAPLIGLGLMGRSPSFGDAYLGWIPVPAVEEADGWWSVTIPVPDPVSGTGKAQPAETLVMRIAAAGSHSTLLSVEEHFRIWYPTGDILPGLVEELAETFEVAYTTYLDFDFGFQRRSVWPFDVVIKDLQAGWYGGFWHSPISENTCFILLNNDYLTDLDEAYATIGHETFHFAQYHCDTREAATKSADFGPQYWLDEATAVWAEVLFVAGEDHVSASRLNRELFPLAGLKPPTGRHDGNHGYGMSSMIKYLVDLHGTDFIGATYDNILDGDAPMVALQNNLPVPYADWWDDYLGELISGGIYHDVEVGDLEAYIDGIIEFTTNQVLEQTEQIELVDLSGSLIVTLLGTSFDSDESLLFSLGGADCTFSLYEIEPDSPVNMLRGGVTSYRLEHPATLASSGKNILTLVSNYHGEAPGFNAMNSMALSAHREEPNVWPTVYEIDIQMKFQAHWVSGSVFDNFSVRAVAFHPDFDGTTYTASWDTIWGGMHAVGDLTLTVDPETESILSWTVDERDDWGGLGYEYIEMSGEGVIPLLHHFSGAMWFTIDGEGACDPLVSLYQIYVDNQGETVHELASYSCAPFSQLRFILSTDE